MKLIVLKVLCTVILFCLTLFLGLIPVKLLGNNRRGRVSRWRELTVAFCSCFAGGVFLATCLLGLIPDVRDTLLEISSVGGFDLDADYPNTEVLVGAGFFIVLFIEQAILSRQDAKKSHRNLQPAIRLTEMGSQRFEEVLKSTEFSDVSDTRPRPESSAVPLNSFDDENYEALPSTRNHSHKTSETGFRSYVLLMALSVHSLFEGLALGLEDNERDVLQLLYALVAHKSVLAFSLGSSLVMSGMTTFRVVKSCILFSFMCPTGISIGIAIMESASTYSSHLVAGLFQGLAAGTFMYVTFFEVMAPEFNSESSSHRLWKVNSCLTNVLVDFYIMLLLGFVHCPWVFISGICSLFPCTRICIIKLHKPLCRKWNCK